MTEIAAIQKIEQYVISQISTAIEPGKYRLRFKFEDNLLSVTAVMTLVEKENPWKLSPNIKKANRSNIPLILLDKDENHWTPMSRDIFLYLTSIYIKNHKLREQELTYLLIKKFLLSAINESYLRCANIHPSLL